MLRVTTKYYAVIGLLFSSLICAGVKAQAQEQRGDLTRSRGAARSDSSITGVYRIDVAASDKLYSVVSEASSNLPFGEQQRFFIDLAVRLTPPDLLAIERRGKTISLASSRAPRITFEADGLQQREQAAGGRVVRTRAQLSGDSLTVSTSGGVDDSFSVTFEPIEGGRRLRVTRRLYAAQLIEPVVVRSVYDKISEVAEWSIYGEPTPAPTDQTASTGTGLKSVAAKGTPASADQLRAVLGEWIAATNTRDVRRLITFYSSELKAFYLKRDVTRSFVREERARAFRQADSVEIRAADPEIIFRDEGRTAIMRFRKQYDTEINGQRRSGEVIQELRWRKTESGWKIFSERDVRVLR
jgi:ketosteroid isomerase-like protein